MCDELCLLLTEHTHGIEHGNAMARTCTPTYLHITRTYVLCSFTYLGYSTVQDSAVL